MPGEEIGIPVLYMTQLVGIALGLGPEELGLNMNSVSPMPIMEKVYETMLSGSLFPNRFRQPPDSLPDPLVVGVGVVQPHGVAAAAVRVKCLAGNEGDLHGDGPVEQIQR